MNELATEGPLEFGPRLSVCNLHEPDVVFINVRAASDPRVAVRAAPIVAEGVLLEENGFTGVPPDCGMKGTQPVHTCTDHGKSIDFLRHDFAI